MWLGGLCREKRTQIMPEITGLSNAKTANLRILAFATQGAGGDDEARLRVLLRDLNAEFLPFQKKDKLGSFSQILRKAQSREFDLLVMEGSGIGGGLAALIARILYRIPYVFSSGDAIAPFLSAKSPLGAPVFWAYERLLCLKADGFIGWTPYLTGRALSMGTPRAVTAAGWAPYAPDLQQLTEQRKRIRQELGIPLDAKVFGIAGSLNWSPRFQYCYGLELVRAAVQSDSAAHVLIVGDGSGLPRLQELAGPRLNQTIFLTGRVPREKVPEYLATMDIGSLPQSVDQVGSFRYTTKLSEYLAMQLPFITTEIPLAYDLDSGGLWRLPGQSPWDPRFIYALATLMASVDATSIKAKRAALATAFPEFERERQIQRVTAFLRETWNRSKGKHQSSSGQKHE